MIEVDIVTPHGHPVDVVMPRGHSVDIVTPHGHSGAWQVAG